MTVTPNSWIKDTYDGDCEWTFEFSNSSATITRELEDFVGASRTRGTKVTGYVVCVTSENADSTRSVRTVWIGAGDDARAALKRAMRVAEGMMI